MNDYYSDLAVEAGTLADGKRLKSKNTCLDGIKITKTYVKTEAEATSAGKRVGSYVTLSCAADDGDARALSSVMQKELAALLSGLGIKGGFALICGLGNYSLTADALGKAVTDRLITGAGGKFEVGFITPSVVSATGIESFDVIEGVVKQIKPAVVVAIDALATLDARRLLSCYQLSTAGIQPGSGVGNAKKLLCREALGVPVIGVGVPFVLKATALAAYYLDMLNVAQKDKANFLEDVKRRAQAIPDELIVTPKDVDAAVEKAASVIARAVNLKFFGVKGKGEGGNDELW